MMGSVAYRIAIVGIMFQGFSCKQEAPPKPAAPATASPPPLAAKNPPPKGDDSDPSPTLHSGPKLTGLEMTVPVGWISEPITPSVMTPQAVFRLPGAEGDSAGVQVRITHGPGMKGKDDINIGRWLGLVKNADGTPVSKEQAKITTSELGNVKLTVVDASGTITVSADGSGEPKTGQRLIAAIVDHPQGPHFVRALGSAASMAKWEASINQFLKSAKTQ